MPGLHLHLYQFSRLLEDFEPALYCHLNRRSVQPQLYATQWFLTLFAYRFPLQLVLRVYDLILSEGLEGAILKFGIVLMQKNAQTLLGMNDMSQLTTFLKERLFDVYIDKSPSANSILESGFFGSTGGVDKEIYRADMLVQDACSVKITPEMLRTYTMEWEEQRAAEKERETELDNLRNSVHHLTGRVRILEDSLTKSDTEHAAAATELVRTKVENQELSDQNDSLKGQVEELKKIVDTQPAEVEERLKEEMERVLSRNVEVQGANRVLEDQMAEMEKDLVDTKMQYAEVSLSLSFRKTWAHDFRFTPSTKVSSNDGTASLPCFRVNDPVHLCLGISTSFSSAGRLKGVDAVYTPMSYSCPCCVSEMCLGVLFPLARSSPSVTNAILPNWMSFDRTYA
jgi:hypothetical protein